MAGITLSYISTIPQEHLAAGDPPLEPSLRAAALSFGLSYARVLAPLQEYIFAPIFFASIGYAIVSLCPHTLRLAVM